MTLLHSESPVLVYSSNTILARSTILRVVKFHRLRVCRNPASIPRHCKYLFTVSGVSFAGIMCSTCAVTIYTTHFFFSPGFSTFEVTSHSFTKLVRISRPNTKLNPSTSYRTLQSIGNSSSFQQYFFLKVTLRFCILIILSTVLK